MVVSVQSFKINISNLFSVYVCVNILKCVCEYCVTLYNRILKAQLFSHSLSYDSHHILDMCLFCKDGCMFNCVCVGMHTGTKLHVCAYT